MNREEWLEKEIRRHNDLFWVVGDPEISDEKFNELTKELRYINPNNPVLHEINTPTVKSEGKIKHKFPMLSLDKMYTIEEIIDGWATKVKRSDKERFLIQNKFDGWSVEKNNAKLSTRGDGFYGDDISDKQVYIKLLDGSPVSNIIYVHGELVMLKSDFEKYRSKILRRDGSQYKTSRTILTGLLADDDIRDDVKRVLTLLPFETFQLRATFSELKNIDWNTLINERKNADYPIDGLVIKLEDEEYGKSLGSTSHHIRSAMALKFTNPTGKTVLRDVIWSVGKTKITPVAVVDPVEIGGVTVDGPNLHNAKYIIDKDIRIGDTLILERCGDIIPDVQQVIPGEVRKTINILNCPSCGSDVRYDEPEIKCTNPECGGMLTRRLLDSIIRIGIDGIGEPTVDKLVSNGYRNLIDVFNLTKEDIMALDGFANTSSDNMLKEILRVKTNGVYEWQILASLNIPLIGTRMSKMILKNMSLEELRNKQISELENLKDVGFITAHSIYCGLLDNKKYIDELLEILPTINENQEEKKTICFTGKMPEPRSYYEKLASANNLEPVKSVNKELDILVCADVNKTGGKINKAKKYGTIMMSVEEFLNLVGGNEK